MRAPELIGENWAISRDVLKGFTVIFQGFCLTQIIITQKALFDA